MLLPPASACWYSANRRTGGMVVSSARAEAQRPAPPDSQNAADAPRNARAVRPPPPPAPRDASKPEDKP
jgi:hypothetical protein